MTTMSHPQDTRIRKWRVPVRISVWSAPTPHSRRARREEIGGWVRDTVRGSMHQDHSAGHTKGTRAGHDISINSHWMRQCHCCNLVCVHNEIDIDRERGQSSATEESKRYVPTKISFSSTTLLESRLPMPFCRKPSLRISISEAGQVDTSH